MAWERRSDRAVLPRILAVAERHVVGPELDGPGRTASRGDRAAPCARAVEAHYGKGLLVQVASRSPAAAGPKAASGHWFLHDDAGAGFSPLPNRVGDRVGVDRLVQRARAVLAELRLIMIRAYEAPMDV